MLKALLFCVAIIGVALVGCLPKDYVGKHAMREMALVKGIVAFIDYDFKGVAGAENLDDYLATHCDNGLGTFYNSKKGDVHVVVHRLNVDGRSSFLVESATPNLLQYAVISPDGVKWHDASTRQQFATARIEKTVYFSFEKKLPA